MIVSAVLQSVLHIVDFGTPPVEAATRIHANAGPLAGQPDPMMAKGHLIAADAAGRWRGAADPRGGGIGSERQGKEIG